MLRFDLVLQWAAAAALLAAWVHALAEAAPRPIRGDVRQELAATDAAPAATTLLEEALLASGVESRQVREAACREFPSRIAAVVAEVRAQRDPQDRCDALLAGLHEQLLTGKYDAAITRVDDTLRSGDFNCVTATLLLHALGEACGVELEAIAGNSHVLSRTRSQPPLYLESTCSTWQAQPLASCPDQIRRVVANSRPLTTDQLLAKLLYNRGVAALEAAHFEDAIGLLKRAARMDPADHAVWDNLAAAYNNWALRDCDAGKYSEAAAKVVAGLALQHDSSPLQANDLYVHQCWAQRLCEEQRYEEALDALAAAHRRRPSAEWFARGMTAVYFRWAYDHFRHDQWEAGWEVLHGMAGREGFTDVSVDRVVRAICAEFRDAGDSPRAARLQAEAIRKLPDSSGSLLQRDAG